MADESDQHSRTSSGFGSTVRHDSERHTTKSTRTARHNRPRLVGIRIQPATLSSTYAEYRPRPFSEQVTLHAESEYADIYRLAFGYLAYVYIDVPGSTPVLLQVKKVPIRALRFLSPVINSTIMANGFDLDLDHIALPPGSRDAYQAILSWLEQSIDRESTTPLSVKPSHTYLIPYQNLLDIVEQLQIRPLIEQTRQRLDFELEYTTAEKYFIHFVDICQLYGSDQYFKEHPLRRAVAKSLARAWIDPALTSWNQKALLSLIVGFEELWVEMVEVLNNWDVWDTVLFPNVMVQERASDTTRREHLCSGRLLNRVYRP